MAELTRDETRYYHLSDVEEYPVAAGVIVYEGAAVGENGSGYARPLVAGDPFLGFASKRASNVAGVAGAERVQVKTNGLIKLLVAGVTVAENRGAEVYASNDGTFTVSVSGSKIGKIHKVESNGYALVRIDVASGESKIPELNWSSKPVAENFGKRQVWFSDIGAVGYSDGESWHKNAHVLTDLADLSTVSIEHLTVFVSDGQRGGTFNWSATGTVDNGVVFAGATGFWHRQYKGKIKAIWFGLQAGGVIDNTAALNAVYAYQNTTQVSTTGTGTGAGGVTDVEIEKGVYLINGTVTIPNAYSRTVGYGALIVKGPSFVGTVGFDFTALWRGSITGVQFRDFDTPISIYNNNINSGLVEVKDCGIFGSTGNGIRIEAQSTHVKITNVNFRNNVHEMNIINCDLVSWSGGWVSRGLLTADQDAGVINHGILNVDGVLGVPTTQTALEPAWINNYRSVKIENTRFGGEAGSHVIVNNFAKWADAPSPVPLYVTIFKSDVFNSAAEKTAIRFFEIPNKTTIRDCTGFTDSGYISWSTTIDAPTQAAKIAEITQTAIDRAYVVISLSDNSSQYSVAAQGLVASNLLPFVATVDVNAFRVGKSHYKESLIDFKGPSTKVPVINFENTDTTITTNQELGIVQWKSNDASGFGAGLVAWIRGFMADGTTNAGAIALGTGTTGTGAAANVADRVVLDQLGNLYPVENNLRTLGSSTNLWNKIFATFIYLTSSIFIKSGSNSPETVVTAPVGSLFVRDNGGVGSTLYAKTSGASNTGWLGVAHVDSNSGLLQPKTITPAGTTGAQTINKPTGAVNFAAAAVSLVVTNSLVTANSVVQCTVGTNDATMFSAKAVVAAGSFTIYPNAVPTAETRVYFSVTN